MQTVPALPGLRACRARGRSPSSGSASSGSSASRSLARARPAATTAGGTIRPVLMWTGFEEALGRYAVHRCARCGASVGTATRAPPTIGTSTCWRGRRDAPCRTQPPSWRPRRRAAPVAGRPGPFHRSHQSCARCARTPRHYGPLLPAACPTTWSTSGRPPGACASTAVVGERSGHGVGARRSHRSCDGRRHWSRSPIRPHHDLPRTYHVSKPVVLIAEELSPATVEALGPDFEIRHCNGADRAELLPAIADVDAILVRSATKVDAEALAAAPRLKVVARAGVGLDNVDVKAATQNGVMVVNAPDLQHRLRRRARRRADAGRRPARRARERRAQGRRVEAQQVHRHRALREDRRHRRPRPDRRARRPAAERLRHEGDRLRPLRPGRPGRPDGRPPGQRSTSCSSSPTSCRCTCRRPRRPSG